MKWCRPLITAAGFSAHIPAMALSALASAIGDAVTGQALVGGSYVDAADAQQFPRFDPVGRGLFGQHGRQVHPGVVAAQDDVELSTFTSIGAGGNLERENRLCCLGAAVAQVEAVKRPSAGWVYRWVFSTTARESASAGPLSRVFVPDFHLEVFPKRHHFDPPHRIEPEGLAELLRRHWEQAEAGR